MKLKTVELEAFSKAFNTEYEEHALTSRGDFLQAFPLESLKDLTLDDYVIGKGTPTFCSRVEVKTKAWANMQGATARKFGIYYGRTKTDPEKTYRFSQKFGSIATDAFANVKSSILALISAGKLRDFQSIEANPLSQMFKAKILSLYYPETYINICSAEHLNIFAAALGLPGKALASEYQSMLMSEKESNSTTKTWTNPKFMSFLYDKFLPEHFEVTAKTNILKPRSKIRREVNFDELQSLWGEIGKLSEEFALQWEKNRLTGLNLKYLIGEIQDRRKVPSYGYDFLSYTSQGVERYIEVKSVGFDKTEKCQRFFLSENERKVSITKDHSGAYYFYLVCYGRDGKPSSLIAKLASELYSNCEMVPYVQIVRFDFDDHQD